LLVGVPGLAKTLMIRTLADSLSLKFSRIQFTPDLMPADITGTEIIEENKATGSREFRFLEGPLFANVILADEINRTPPKTQAALLEAMQEHQVTVGGQRHRLSEPFFVLATQNPIEQEGTYPLPEAQLDRFMLRLRLGYPSAEAEAAILDSQTSGDPYATLEPVVAAQDVLAMQEAVMGVRVAPELRRYVVDVVAATREDRDIYLGASPRAGIALLRAAKALAVLRGRDYVVPQDVKDLGQRVLSHRIILSTEASTRPLAEEHTIGRILEAVPVPGPGR